MEETPISTTKREVSWLQRLKDESWEAELLVSAVAIFAILQSFDLLDWMIAIFIDYLDPGQYNIGYMIVVCGFLAIGILAAMFAIHFMLRAYWIGLVGLNSVFPDYSLEDSAYSPIYTRKILEHLPKLKDSINKVDELCSVIFAAAFSLMLIYSYITLSATLYLILFNVLYDYMPAGWEWLLFLPLVLSLSLLAFGILLSIPANLKKFRHHEKIQHAYFLYAKYAGYMTYGPLYKSVNQITMTFGSNFKRKKGLVKMVLFMLFVGVIFGMAKLLASDFAYLVRYDIPLDSTKMHAEYYEDSLDEVQLLVAPTITSAYVSQDHLKLFVPIFEHQIRQYRQDCDIPDTRALDKRAEVQQAYLDCYVAKHQVLVDGVPVTLSLLKTDHPKTGQFGITGYVALDALAPGPHKLTVVQTIDAEESKRFTIPFHTGR